MRMRVLAVTLSAGVGLSACGGQSRLAAQAPPPPSPVASRSGGSVELDGSPAIEKIKARGKLMVGLRSEAPMFAVRDGSGRHSGFDVEIARILASGLGLDPETQVTFRWLPATLRMDALTAGNVDVQIGGVDPADPKMTTVGPYAVTDGTETKEFIGLKPGDDGMREQLQHILDAAVADGRWQRAYDSTLRAAGISARPH
jgi:polar amino acid transport system substrate-binding protein